MKMSCATFKAKTENPPMAPFAKGGGPKDRGIFASSRHFQRAPRRKGDGPMPVIPSEREGSRFLPESILSSPKESK